MMDLAWSYYLVDLEVLGFERKIVSSVNFFYNHSNWDGNVFNKFGDLACSDDIVKATADINFTSLLLR